MTTKEDYKRAISDAQGYKKNIATEKFKARMRQLNYEITPEKLNLFSSGYYAALAEILEALNK